MKISKERLVNESIATGFRPEILEKVLRLIDLLNAFIADTFLHDRIVLKGGTALNLFYFLLPRLSVDIDLNYIGSVDKKKMLEEKPLIIDVLTSICEKKEYTIRRQPHEHAGGKLFLGYRSDLIGQGQLAVDINFLSRVNLWPHFIMDSCKLSNYQAVSIPVLNYYDLIGGKLNALFSRHSGRDLYDVYNIFKANKKIDFKKVKLAFVVYGAMSRKDWRTLSIDQLKFHPLELKNNLLPMLNVNQHIKNKDIKFWANEINNGCISHLSKLLKYNDNELEFLTHINDKGIIKARLLTENLALIKNIDNNPALLWKCQNVLEYFKTKN